MTLKEEFFDTNNQITKANVLKFFKCHPLCFQGNDNSMPKSGSIGDKLYDEEFVKKKFTQVNPKSTLQPEGVVAKVYWIDFESPDDRNGNRVIIKHLPDWILRRDEYPRAYYLPWKPMNVMYTQLPSQPATPFFYTAALAGCSVFATGTAQSPTVYHAGSEAKFKGNTPKLWEKCIKKIKQKQESDDSYVSVNKNDYMTDPNSPQNFKNWVRDHIDNKLKVEVKYRSGAVFGVFDNNGWELYLQESALCRTLELFKLKIGAQLSMKKARPSLGPTKIEKKKIDRDLLNPRGVGYNVVREQWCVIGVRKFFPEGSFAIPLKHSWRVNQ